MITTIVRFLVTRGLIVNLISIFLFLLGLATAIFSIQIEAFPNVNLDKIQVDVSYPGASPQEIEQLIITPIEQELRALNGIDEMVSMSFPNSGRIVMDVDPKANNREKLSSEISLAVDRAKLPADLPNDPYVTEIDGAVFPIIRLALSAPISELELKRLGDNIKDDLLAIKGVARVAVQGNRKAEYRVTLNPRALQRERLSASDIAAVIKGWNLNSPGGDLDTNDGQKSVRVVGEFTSAEDAGNLILRANDSGNVLRLRDVATVIEALEVPRTLYDVEGQPALSMLVLKRVDGDIIKTVDAILEYTATVPQRYGDHVHIKDFQDFSRFARIRLGVLTNNGLVGVFLVFVSLLLFLRFSVAMTTTWGLPIIFMTGIFMIHSFGITLNLISMMGFIMVLGMLVDDAIIIGENITHHMEQGLNPVEAAVKGAVELIGPVTTTIMTTVAAFIPMMFMSGIIGKFIIAIPIVVVTLLVLSWLESFLILPSHVAHVTNPDKHPPTRAWLLSLENAYVGVLGIALRFRWTTVLLSFLLLFASFVLANTRMSFQLFPPVGVEEFITRVTAPPGTNLASMRQYLRDIDTDMRSMVKPEYLEATIAKSGDVSVDEGDPLTQRGSRYGQIRAIYTPAVTRPDHNVLQDMHDISKVLKQKYPQFDIDLTEIRPGPPVGRALEAEISSTYEQASETAARGLMAYLKTIPGVTTVDSGLKQGDDEIHVVLDRQLATYAGVDLTIASSQIRAATGGLVVSTVRHGTEEIDVTLRYPNDSSNELEQLRQVQVPNNRGGQVPLHKIARFEQQDGFTTIRHKDAIRIVSVVADIDSDVITSSELNELVQNNAAQWQADVVDKVKVNYGGEEEKNQESFRSLIIAFGFALVAIFFILAIQFNNLSYPLIVMLAIPFGAIGIIISFYFHDIYWKPMPLSFFSSLGMVALTGVVVNSSLVLLVFIQRARQDGVELYEAILLAGRRRLRAVLLTATTTIVGLLPTAYGWGGLDNFISPIALALSWGLVFATVITLVTIPATLLAGHDVRVALRRVLSLS